MKLISETLVSRSKVDWPHTHSRPVVMTNYGTERRYRRSPWDFLGLFDKRKTEWEGGWTVVQIAEE